MDNWFRKGFTFTAGVVICLILAMMAFSALVALASLSIR
jgi:hypothetical protein